MNTNKNVKIKIDATHKMYDTNDSHTISEEYLGQIHLKNGKYYILYESLNEDTKAKESNTIRIENETITIIKNGQAKTTLRFEEGTNHKTDYVTPFGTFGLETDTRKYTLTDNDNDMFIRLEYTLYLNGQKSSDCTMDIMIG